VDFTERLTNVEAETGSLAALEHGHRYELAASLCDGLRVADVCCGSGYGSRMLAERAASVLGVDLSPEAIDDAVRTFGGLRDGLEFEVGDALEFLSSDLRDRFDAIVIFEGLEHLPELDAALEALARQERAGLRLVLSVPNDRAFESDNPYHESHFGYEEMLSAFGRFDDVEILYQFCAQGTLIRGERAGELESGVTLLDHGDLAYANNFVACVGFGDDPALASLHARMHLMLAPENNLYQRSLYRTNKELWRTNLELGTNLVGSTGSAAASVLRRQTLLEEELESMKRSFSWRVTKPLRRLKALLRR
jgi:SAM-dependent methyltransferase